MHNKPGEITESYDSNGYEIASWKAMGVGIEGNYAVVWFGMIEDPAGTVPTTNTFTSEDYPDIEGTACTESYRGL